MSRPAADQEKLDIELAVSDRYSAASQAAETALCCPVQYQSQYLEVLPQELIERDYGCGDPSRFLKDGDTVLDLGSGGGKICYIASQVVGSSGRVIGVDMNERHAGSLFVDEFMKIPPGNAVNYLETIQSLTNLVGADKTT